MAGFGTGPFSSRGESGEPLDGTRVTRASLRQKRDHTDGRVESIVNSIGLKNVKKI